MKTGVITGLNSTNGNGKKIHVDEKTLYPCSRCHRIMTTSHSEKISCVEGGPSFIDANGTIYFQHQFDEPLDADLYIKYFREKHRLCWKEIYLKFTVLMSHEAQKCLKCNQWWQLSQMAGCDGDFHEIQH